MFTHDEIMAELLRQLDEGTIKPSSVAEVLGIDRSRISEMRKGGRQIQQREMPLLVSFLKMGEQHDNPHREVRLPPGDYLPIEVLPTYAGMGGGGTGDGERDTALIPRSLIVHELRGRPENFLLVNVRGDSMEPDFRHGDQILIDRRDISPSQPGPFALWDGEWGEYVIKNVERLPGGEVRIFSTNPKYTGVHTPADTTKIMGRPVWFGRRL